MNHIHKLTAERDEARAQLEGVAAELNELLSYLSSDKFSGDGDFVHVRTDLMPKLLSLRLALL